MKFSRGFTFLLCLSFTASLSGSDWPMWRRDANRSAASAADLPAELHLLWERSYTPRTMVWDDPLNQDLMPYDQVFEPVVAGGRMFLGFNDCDKVVALDTESGEEIWTFYTDGPVRLPPVAWENRVYFASDDSYLYCVEAETGKLCWKFSGGPSEKKIIGNRRLISAWPARGGPVIQDSTVYFAASIWPFMGTFIYALDAGTGEVKWVNDRTGSDYILQPHHSPAFAGVAPQGALVSAADRLLVPGGRSVPACFDRIGGGQLYYHLSDQNKTGGSFVCASAEVGVFFNHHRDQVVSMYDLETGNRLVPEIGRNPVLTETTFYLSTGVVAAFDAGELKMKSEHWREASLLERELSRALEPLAGPSPGLTGKYYTVSPALIGRLHREWFEYNAGRWKESILWEVEADGSQDLIKAGNFLYAAGGKGVTAIKLPAGEGQQPELAWSKTVKGGCRRLLAAGGKLFVSTLDGRILAFGGTEASPNRISRRVAAALPSAEAVSRAQTILRNTGVKEGYALVRGLRDGGLLQALALSSELRIIAFDPDSARVSMLRSRLDSTGLYGERIVVLREQPGAGPALPPYLATLTVAGDLPQSLPEADSADAAGKSYFERMIKSMRPYGGKAWLGMPKTEQEALINRLSGVLNRPELELTPGEEGLVLTRLGPLPGAAPWTHQYGNPANTVKSDDSLVALPLGILWFGGSSNLDVLPRHGHGPPEQVVGGRLFIEGMDCISARDVYTGRVLWKTAVKDLDSDQVYYDDSYQDAPTSTAYNQEHIPGANIRGTNFVAAGDLVYVVQQDRCRVLDAATGKTVRVIPLPAAKDLAEPQWGYIGVCDSFLVAGSGLVAFSSMLPGYDEFKQQLEELPPRERRRIFQFTNFDKSASRRLTVMDRHSGETLWSIESVHGFAHNAIAAAAGKIFCLDKLPPFIENQLRRRGKSPSTGDYRLLALDLRTGEILWENREIAFGTWLSYSSEHDVLLQSTRPSRDMVEDETGERMAAFGGSDGSLIWDKALSYSSLPILHGTRIITQGEMINLLTGEPELRKHPITGEPIPSTWLRHYGCNYPIASENLLTFRSAAAGFYDLVMESGTGNLGGFKSGCTSNLVAADGVLNAPDYTRTCACSYQNQTSLALVHDPDVDFWTFSTLERGSAPVKRVGINFGAPGDRMAVNGTLWLDYPSVGGPSPDVPVSIVGKNPVWFRRHPSCIKGEGLRWVACSGVESLEGVTVVLADKPGEARSYTVRLYFAECRQTEPGVRIFDVAVQGRRVLKDFDILKEAGQPFRVVEKEYANILVNMALNVTFAPGDSAAQSKPLICGIEIVAEDRQ